MNAVDKIYSIIKQNGGYLTTKEANDNGIKNYMLFRMEKRGVIERVAHGLYVGTDTIPDPFFVLQYRCPKAIFSNETTLFLHNFSDRNPLRFMVTIPSGWNTPLLTDEEIYFFYSSPKKFELGVCEVQTSYGTRVKVYDIERTLCDCLRNIDKLDRDIVLTALKKYVRETNRDGAKLLKYAEVLKIRDIVYRYLEILI